MLTGWPKWLSRVASCLCAGFCYKTSDLQRYPKVILTGCSGLVQMLESHSHGLGSMHRSKRCGGGQGPPLLTTTHHYALLLTTTHCRFLLLTTTTRCCSLQLLTAAHCSLLLSTTHYYSSLLITTHLEIHGNTRSRRTRREAPREAPLPRLGSDPKICMTYLRWTDARSSLKQNEVATS